VFLRGGRLGLRETINRHPKISTTAVVCLAAAGLVAIALELRGNDGKPPAKNFFSIDDGKTWFVDSSQKLPPYDYEGGKAVRCYLFKGPQGKFVGLLEKYSDSTRAQLASKSATASTGELPVLVKKPGEAEWQPMDSTQEAMTLMEITGAEASGIERIMP
jgi:hypothetical protein